MTITEELDKKSGRPYRSKNIMDALKYAFGFVGTPKNIAEGVKAGTMIYPIWHLGVALAPKPTEEQGVANNNKVKDVTFDKATNTAVIEVKLADLEEFPSSDPNQGTHKWIAVKVSTGINPITNLKYNDSNLTEQDIADADATGCEAGAFVLYIKADEVVSTDKVFTLKADGNEDKTVTIKVVEPTA